MLQRESGAGQGTLRGRVAIVTGASSGIGAASAHELARRGAKVVLAARRADLLEAQAQAIRATGASALAIATDLSDGEQLAELVHRARTTFERVDILVNNAGANWSRPHARTDPGEIARLQQVNLLG